MRLDQKARAGRGRLLFIALFTVAVLSGCAAPLLLGAGAVANRAEGGARAASGRPGSDFGKYLPEAKEFPTAWQVSRTELLQAGPFSTSSPLDGFLLVFGNPPPQCALPQGLLSQPGHVSVQGASVPSLGKDMSALFTGFDIHSAQVEVGPAAARESLVDQLRTLGTNCQSFKLANKSDYDSSFQATGSITPADPKLGFGSAAGVTLKLTPGSSVSSTDSGSAFSDLSVVETVYVAKVKATTVVAVSVSFKDGGDDAALALKLFTYTAKRVNEG